MIRTIAVLGAGTMGSRMSQLFAENGYSTVLYDPNKSSLYSAEQRNRLSCGAPVTYTSDRTTAVHDADLILEAAPEQLELKRSLYLQIAPIIQPDTIVASNTSTFPLAALTDGIPFSERFIIAHFFNPAHLIPLVELVGSEACPTGVMEEVCRLLTSCGKVPVVLKNDIPGFIANRLQAALFREACHLLEEGIADADQIDKVVREGIGLRWAVSGPFEIADMGGLDIWQKVADHLFPSLDSSAKASVALQKKVQEGNLGYKSGAGFYAYQDSSSTDDTAARRDNMLEAILQVKGNK